MFLRRINPSIINWGDPLNRGLTRWWRFGARNYCDATSPRDLVRQWAVNLNSGAIFRATKGRQHSFRSVEMDGVDDYLQAGTCPFASAPLTISYWHRPSALTGVAFWCGQGGALLWRGFYQGMGADGSISFYTVQDNDFTAAATTTNGIAVAGKWHFVTCVTASATSRFCYINGGNSAGENTTSMTPTGVNEFYLGCDRSGSGRANFCGGFYDDIRIWNRALSGREVAQLYQASLAGYPQQLTPMGRVFPGFAVAVSTFQPAWVSQRSKIIGAGVN